MKIPASQIDFTATSLMAGLIEYYTLDENEVAESISLSSLIKYIEKNDMNDDDVMTWLDKRDDSYALGYRDNFEMVTEMYYREVIAGEELSHAA